MAAKLMENAVEIPQTKATKPKVHTHTDTGLKYLSGKETVLFENGITVPRKEFDGRKDIPQAVKNILKAASEKDKNFDFAYACSTGTLRRKKGAACLVANPRTARRRIRQEKAVEEARHEEQKKEASKEWLLSSAFLMVAVMAIVGVGSAVMSAYHTTTFLYEGGKPFWTSILTGTMLILFSGTAFTAARYFFQEKGTLKLFGWFFTLAGLAVIAYSIFSTITVNYNQFKNEDDQKTETAVVNSEALAAHRRLLAENMTALEEAREEITTLEKETEYWRSFSWKRYDEFNTQLIQARKRRDALRSERTRLEAATPELTQEAAASQETVYSFLARLMGLPEDIARFFVYVIPACLYDILAPFALSVVLLLIDRRKKAI